MAIDLYGIKACDTCRKARKMLEEQGYSVNFVDVRETPLSDDTLARFLSTFDEDVINRRSTTWRGLSENERAATHADLLKAHPTLMKRPVIDHGGTLHLGWGKDVQAVFAGG